MADDNAAKRARLQELVGQKRKQAEEAAEAERQALLQRRAALPIDFGDDSDEDDEGAAAGGECNLGLPNEMQSPVYGPMKFINCTDPSHLHSPSSTLTSAADGAAAAAAPPVDENEEDLVVTDADRAFIDDTGVAPENQYDFGDDDVGDEGPLTFDEAEEAREDGMEDELDRMFGRNKRRHEDQDEAENRAVVQALQSQMELALENDLELYQKRQPAVKRLQMLSRVQDVLSRKKLHAELLDSGILGTLKAWIEPMPDGTLPNSKIRSTILSLLLRLPVDTSYEDRRQQLKSSELGRMVMFYSKVPDETPENRKIARELVERWSRPILAPRGMPEVDEEEGQRILEARQRRQRALQEQAKGEGDGEGAAKALRPGDPGFRFHAAIPQAASLDYVKRPESRATMVDKRSGGKSSEHKLSKKLKTLGKVATKRAANVSVEGRNVTVTNT